MIEPESNRVRETPANEADRTSAHVPDPDATTGGDRSSYSPADDTNVRTTEAPTAPDISWEPLPGFELLSELGRGGMGVVYMARQTKLNRVVALKMILSGEHAGEKDLIRFLVEAESIAAVKHPNVVQVFDYGESSGRPYMVLEFCDGGSLAERLDGKQLEPHAAAELIGKIARGIAAAHELGIVHRDLKPANVLLGADGEPKVTDFGLAKRTAGADLTQTNSVMGTPAYMSPEQAKGGTKFVGPQADVWALGVILYECLTGTRPFTGGDSWTIIRAVIEMEPLAPRKLTPRVPRDLDLICVKCLAKEPAERYHTAKELADELARWSRGEAVSVRGSGLVERAAKWARRKPTLAAAYGLTAFSLILAALVAGALWMWQRAEGARTEAEVARDGERNARGEVAFLNYSHAVDLAHREYEADNVIRAIQLLESCPMELRGWEWRYVHRLCHSEIILVEGLDAHRSAWFSTDGKRMITASLDKSVRLWDAQTGKQIALLKTPPEKINTSSFSPDGHRILTASTLGTTQVWDAEFGSELFRLEGDARLESVSFSKDGRYIVGIDRKSAIAWVWDARTGKQRVILKGHTNEVMSASFSPDGLRIVTASQDETARIWDVETGTELLQLKGHTFIVHYASFSVDGRRIVTTSNDTTARVWDAETGKELACFKGHKDTVNFASFSPDGRRIVTFALVENQARVWDAQSGTEVAVLEGHRSGVLSACFSADGSRIATASYDTTARVWDARTGKEVVRLRGHTNWILAAAFSEDGRRLLTTSEDRTAKVWDIEPPPCIRGHSDLVSSTSFSSDGRRIVTASLDNTTRVWDTKDGTELAMMEGNLASFSKDDRRVVTAARGAVRVYDADTGRELVCCRGHSGPIQFVSFTGDGRHVITASLDTTARIWDVESGKERARFEGHKAQFTFVALSADGRLAATAAFVEELARVWDTDTGRETARLQGLLEGQRRFHWTAAVLSLHRWMVKLLPYGTCRLERVPPVL